MKKIKTIGMTAMAGLWLLPLGVREAYAQPPAAGAPAPAPVKRPAPPELLFRMELENATRRPVGPAAVTNPNLELQTYGDGQNIVISIGHGEYDPHTFDGLCERPCGMTFRDKNNYFDLTGKAKIKWTTIVSGFHRVRPLIKLADGKLLVGDQAAGSAADWQQSEVSFSEVRWLELDPARGVTLGRWIEHPNLSKVEEAGFFDVIPGSGVHVEGVAVEKLPNPPAGGWTAIAAFELWGHPVSREDKASQ